MMKMQESEFDLLNFTENPRTCEHTLVKLYEMGMETDYGCIKCGKKSYYKEDFDKNKA